MYVVEVVLLSRSGGIESLSYYSSIPYEPGVILEIPVRKKTKSGVVVGTKSVSAAKTAVRAATFSLKKLPQQLCVHRLPSTLLRTTAELAKHYPTTLGAILFSLLPPEVRSGEQQLEVNTPDERIDIRPEVSLLTARYDERFTEYRSKIRETFAHRGSMLLVVPTTQHAIRASEYLSHGIEDRLVLFTNALSKKRLANAYSSFYDLSVAKLIIATPTHAYLDRHDITHIIIEEARSRQYISKYRPYLDHRTALRIHARTTSRTMTLGDLLPRSEDEAKRRDDVFATLEESPKRISFHAKLEPLVIRDEPTGGKPFELLSPILRNKIGDALRERKRIFVYAARRGIAPLVVCLDCGHIFRDPDSGAPYSLFRTGQGENERRWFLSSVSGRRIAAKDTCEECGSWRLRERGVGIQHIESEFQTLFKNTPLFVFDHTTTKTRQRAHTIIGGFYDSKGSILLGTNKVLPYLERPVDISIITSSEAARAIPSWRADEDFFALLLQLREATNEVVYMQTRTEPDELFGYATQGLIEQFYTEELSLRETLLYPPFSTLILLTWQGTRDAVTITETELDNVLSKWKPRYYSEPNSLLQKTTRHGLIRVPLGAWPDEQLVEALRTLPPYIKIEINPDRIV